MKPSVVEALVWVLIYGGLLGVCTGLAAERYGLALGEPLVTGGSLVAALGVLLIYLRSRMRD